MTDKDTSVLTEAQGLVHGDRNVAYGHPLDDFQCTADMWRAYLKHKHKIDVPLEAEDVGMMMVMVKISRQANKPKRDNLVDGSGYFETVNMVIEEREHRRAKTKLDENSMAMKKMFDYASLIPFKLSENILPSLGVFE